MNFEEKMIDQAENMTFPKVIKWVAIIMVVSSLLGVFGSYLGLIGTVATAPAKVIKKTLETDNIIQSYEWFYDVNAGYIARSGQISEFKSIMSEEFDRSERSRLRIDLAAIKQSCRDLTTKYNANSEKMNKSIFKGWELPESLIVSSCD